MVVVEEFPLIAGNSSAQKTCTDLRTQKSTCRSAEFIIYENMYIGKLSPFPPFPDIPLHVAMITHILIAWDRKRWLSDPVKCRFPAFVCCCATWLTGMIIALPYPIYTIYLEMGPPSKDTGIIKL
uniref:Uncharacterized protein n=1 Tax=Glossina pallidipes TaxID=7398 RepID=A0A1A9ZTM4_GLOPL